MEVRLTAFYALIQCHLSYGVILWGQSADLGDAFILQKRAIRVIVRRGPREHCRPWFKSLGILTLPCLYIFATCLHVHDRLPMLPRRADVHCYSTRGRDLLDIQFSRTYTSKKNKINLDVYNRLPAVIKASPPGEFKGRLKNYLIASAFYSVNEYLRSGP